MSLVVIVPMLGRPQWVAPLVESIRSTCDGRILFGLTPGDLKVFDAVIDAGCEWFDVDHQPGDYARKVNIGYRLATELIPETSACHQCNRCPARLHDGGARVPDCRTRPGTPV